MKPKSFWSLKKKLDRKSKVESGQMEKYGNKVTSHAGYSFSSKLEAAVFDLLNIRVLAGEIKDLQCQATVYLTAARIKMIPDFSAIETASGDVVYFEAKGFPTDIYRLKKRLWTVYGPGKLHVYTGSYSSPKLSEVIIPTGEEEKLPWTK